MLKRGLLLFLLVASLVPALALAQSADNREPRARELFAAGQYSDALDIYIKLYSETTHPTYMRNIGRCYQNLGQPEKAISSFREYLRQAKDLPPDQRALVETYIREMEEQKKSRGDSGGIAQASPRSDVVSPGTATSATRALVAPETSTKVSATAIESRGSVPMRTSAVDGTVGGTSRAVLAWSAVGVGTTLALGGAGTMLLESRRAGRARDNHDPAAYDQAQTPWRIGLVGAIVGGTGVVLGTALLLSGHSAAPARHAQATPWLGVDGAGVQVYATW